MAKKDERSKTDKYSEYINDHILPKIDYAKLHQSYETDMVYAKEVLGNLHKALVEVYGSAQLNEDDGDEDGYVLVPGVIRGTITENMCVALFSLDLSGQGELWETHFLCKYGIISQAGEGHNPQMIEALKNYYVPYKYCYTVDIPCDIHVHKNTLPKAIKEVLAEYHQFGDGDEEEEYSEVEKIIMQGLQAYQCGAHEMAVQLLTKAAEMGHPAAQINLGTLYHEGLGTPRDDAKAVEWLEKAAEQGYADAHYRLGQLYFDNGEAADGVAGDAEPGEGAIPSDNAKALAYFEKAAELGNADSQYALGLYYSDNLTGIDNPNPDMVKAVELYEKAAVQGHTGAQYALDSLR